jgi:hypothetical protein
MRHFDRSPTPRPVLSRADILTDITCDRCGASVMEQVDSTDTEALRPITDTHNALLASFNLSGEYGSTRFDGDEWHADLCEDCAVAIKDFIDAGPGPGVDVAIGFDWTPAADEKHIITGPFSDEQIALYRGQHQCYFHHIELRIGRDSLRCPHQPCSYEQLWAREADFG